MQQTRKFTLYGGPLDGMEIGDEYVHGEPESGMFLAIQTKEVRAVYGWCAKCERFEAVSSTKIERKFTPAAKLLMVAVNCTVIALAALAIRLLITGGSIASIFSW